MKALLRLAWCLAVLSLCDGAAGADDEPTPQYSSGEIVVPGAHVDEPLAGEFSLTAALDYLDRGAIAWTRSKKCVTCHTNGAYMAQRMGLPGKPASGAGEVRDFFLTQLDKFEKAEATTFESGTSSAAVVQLAAGLAAYDAHAADGQLSEETRRAVDLMFNIQQADGSWQSTTCWPPFESSPFQVATVAVAALGTAPGWKAEQGDKYAGQIERLVGYLKTTEAPHDYARVLRLRAATHLPEILEPTERDAIVVMILENQRADGGWSIRTFATPEQWGSGNRAEKLRDEPEFENLPSDGHQTGLCLLALHDAGLPADHPAVERGLKWLLANQRESGRWWTRSLNTDRFHFVTFSGTLYAVTALAEFEAWSAEVAGEKVSAAD